MNPQPIELFEPLIAELMRSVVAGSRRRRAMREELLAHLYEAYQQERSQGLDESAARQAAIRRFGNLADLQHQIQSSVPSFERWLVVLFASKENVMSIGPRVAGWVMCVIGGAFMVGMAVVLPASAKLTQALPPGFQSAGTSHAALTLKLSLAGLIAFSLLVTLAGVGILAYAFFTRKKVAHG